MTNKNRAFTFAFLIVASLLLLLFFDVAELYQVDSMREMLLTSSRMIDSQPPPPLF